METYRQLLDRLTRLHPTLTPQVQKAAAHILANPGEVATLSMRKLAAASAVPPPTLPRLAQALGYDTYEAFRDVFRTHLQDRAAGYVEQANQLVERGADDDSASLLSAFHEASRQNTEHLFRTIDAATIDAVTKSLHSARTVYVVGMQASYATAAYFHYVGSMAFGNWVLIDNRDGNIAEQIIDMNEEDVLVAISMPPSARESIVVADFARSRGTTVVGITNSRITPLASRSDHILVVAMQSPQFFESFVTATLLLEVLLGFAVVRGGKKTIDRIETIEASRRRLGEYWEKE